MAEIAGQCLIALCVVYGSYVYLGYPALLWLCGRIWGRDRVGKDGVGSAQSLRIAVVVAAHDEEEQIEARINDILLQDCAVDEVIVGSDGSTDGTVAAVRAMADRRIRCIVMETQGGRARLHNACVRETTADLLLFTDADTRFAAGAVSALVQPFGDPTVGVVVGDLRWEGSNGAINSAANAFWRFEATLRLSETRLGLFHTGSGPFMAVRRECFLPLRPDEDVDFATPLDALAHGYKCVFAPDAVAIERSYPTGRAEVRARSRMVAKNMVGSLRRVCSQRRPLRLRVRWAFYSHKFLRWLTPCLAVPLLAGLVLARSVAWAQLVGAGCVVFSILAVWGVVADIARWARAPSFVRAFGRLAFAEVGLALGLWRAISGERISVYR